MENTKIRLEDVCLFRFLLYSLPRELLSAVAPVQGFISVVSL